MARWRKEAIDRLPELRGRIEQSPELMALWIELLLVFEKAYDISRNDGLIQRIYDFAKWCESAPRDQDAGRDPLTAVCLAFYEHIPETEAARNDMHRWFTRSQIVEGREIFSRHISSEQYDQLLGTFDERTKRTSDKS